MHELTARHSLAAIAAAVVAASLFASRAHAEDAPRVTLVWRAPAGCPERDAVLVRVEQLLGARETAARGGPLDVREFVTLTAEGRFRAELGTVQAGVERSRSLDAATCSEIAEASAVVIALAVSPEADAVEPSAPRLAMPPLDSSPQDTPGSPAAKSGPPQDGATTRRSRTRVRRGTLRARLDAGFAVDLGAIAPVVPGLSVAGAARYGRYVELALRGSFFPEQSSALAERPNQGVRLFLAEATPLMCVTPLDLAVELAACGEFALGYLHATGFGTPTHYRRAAWWVAPGVGSSAAYPERSRFRTRLSADLLFPLQRTEFVLTGAGVPHRLPAVAPRLGLYLELAFP